MLVNKVILLLLDVQFKLICYEFNSSVFLVLSIFVHICTYVCGCMCVGVLTHTGFLYFYLLFVRVGVHIHIHVPMEAREHPWVSFLRHHPHMHPLLKQSRALAFSRYARPWASELQESASH